MCAVNIGREITHKPIGEHTELRIEESRGGKRRECSVLGTNKITMNECRNKRAGVQQTHKGNLREVRWETRREHTRNPGRKPN